MNDVKSDVSQGWRLDEEGSLTRETQQSMLRRCNGWDYQGAGIYMITLVLTDRTKPVLGSLVLGDTIAEQPGRPGSNSGTYSAMASPSTGLALFNPSPLGRVVEECWERIPEFHPQIKIIGKQVMPDHFHGILWVKERLPCHLGQVIKGFKLGCYKGWRGAEGPHPIWAEGFQDTILLHKGQLARMINYIRDNPRRLAVKRRHPDLFHIRRDLAVPLPDGTTGRFSAIGNHFLLDHPQILQVQCSRRHFARARPPRNNMPARSGFTTPEFESKKTKLLAAALHGAVLCSPCISDGEKEITRAAFDAQTPLIVLCNKGFAPCYKPMGRFFDACASGRLLMLAPAAWPWYPGRRPITREEALTLNGIAARLASPVLGDTIAESVPLLPPGRPSDSAIFAPTPVLATYLGRVPEHLDRLVDAAISGGRPKPLQPS